MVDHGIHGTRRDAEEIFGSSELLEIAEVVLPVRLRDDSDLETFCFENATYNCSPERWMVDIGIATEKHDIHLVPPSKLGLLDRCWQPEAEVLSFRLGRLRLGIGKLRTGRLRLLRLLLWLIAVGRRHPLVGRGPLIGRVIVFSGCHNLWGY